MLDLKPQSKTEIDPSKLATAEKGDIARSVVATGGRLGLKDSGETPDLVQATYEYPGFIMSYEVCALNGHGAGGRTQLLKKLASP